MPARYWVGPGRPKHNVNQPPGLSPIAVLESLHLPLPLTTAGQLQTPDLTKSISCHLFIVGNKSHPLINIKGLITDTGLMYYPSWMYLHKNVLHNWYIYIAKKWKIQISRKEKNNYPQNRQEEPLLQI